MVGSPEYCPLFQSPDAPGARSEADAVDEQTDIGLRLRRLTPRQQLVMEMMLEKGYTQADVAAELGVSRAAVSTLVGRVATAIVASPR